MVWELLNYGADQYIHFLQKKQDWNANFTTTCLGVIYMKNLHWSCIIWENTAIVGPHLRQAIWDQCWKFWQIHFGWQQIHCGLGQIYFGWEEIHSESIKNIYFFTNQSFYHLEAMASLTSNRMDWSPEPLRAGNSYTTNAPKYENRNTRFPTLQMLPNIT